MRPSSLPQPTPFPTRHPSCCASLSLPLLSHLHAVLPPPPAPTLSIGSGTGLLEALLLQQHPCRAASLRGVEVAADPPVNRFLPDANADVVPGTWAVAAGVRDAVGLLFVYPRAVRLVRAYVARAAALRVVVWIGPRCDFEEFKGPLEEWCSKSEGLAAGEGLLMEAGELLWVFWGPSAGLSPIAGVA